MFTARFFEPRTAPIVSARFGDHTQLAHVVSAFFSPTHAAQFPLLARNRGSHASQPHRHCHLYYYMITFTSQAISYKNQQSGLVGVSNMFRLNAGKTPQYCDGLSRRSFLQLGVAGMASLGLADVLRARATANSRRDNAVILLWLDGGPSHLDLYDMKPGVPVEYRSYWRPIRTNVPGLDITELFPKQAKVADKFSIVRSLYHDSGDHYTGGHIMLTGRAGRVSANKVDGEYPSIGSILAKLRGRNRPGMPAYVALPFAKSIGIRPGYFGAEYLG